ncbi:DHA1 family bicyclomycin/chloramphenicol resistance-like MFS transporter [Crossiella equi]|uniref:DHA1 family bicyclomycin/chloramphenicol resistance-like MFS transporter n=1 Tax=Crossiella equi TaxID=130796 RepID=A0ABS5AQJ4_9PSEU|nr:multidrug effflux MFS transporter [Crossiella equi]MBP2478820.1 DHA1 family bicyclomycin/chloramphenicol resistance-like MFS transporter [Crossiella equi]
MLDTQTAAAEVRVDSRAATALLAVLLGGVTAFGPLTIDMYLPAFPRIAADLSTTASQVQLTLTACLIGLALGQLVIGPLSDILGRRRPLLTGLAVYAVTSVVCVFATSVTLLVGLRFVQGVAGAAGIVIARAIVRDLYSGVAAARFFSNLMLISGLAPILAPVIGGQLLRVGTWHSVFAVLAGFAVVLFFGGLFGLRETLPPERRHGGGLTQTFASIRTLVRDRAFVGYVLTSGLTMAAMFAYISGSPFVLQELYGASPQTYSLIFGANAVGIVAVAQLNGRLAHRVRSSTLLNIGVHVVGAAGLALLGVAVFGGVRLGLFAFLVPLFVLIASVGMVLPTTTTLAMADHPESAGAASALLGAVQFVVGGVAAPLVGLAGAGSAVPMAAVMALMGVAAFLMYRLVARPAARKARAA